MTLFERIQIRYLSDRWCGTVPYNIRDIEELERRRAHIVDDQRRDDLHQALRSILLEAPNDQN